MLETDVLVAERASKTTLVASWNSAGRREWCSSTIIGWTDCSIARRYKNLADSLRWGKNGRSKTLGWIIVPRVQLRGKFNYKLRLVWLNGRHCKPLHNSMKVKSRCHKVLSIHTLYSLLIEQLSIRWRHDRTCCLMLSEASLWVVVGKVPMVLPRNLVQLTLQM